MATQLKISVRSVVLVLGLVLLLWVTNANAQVAVIAHKSVPVDTIKKSELMDFYTKDIKEWNDGQPVTVFDLKSRSETKDAFYAFLGKSASRMKSVWLKKMLLGEGEPPESIDSEEKILKKVGSTAGAIGYVSHANVSKDVKILIKINELKE